MNDRRLERFRSTMPWHSWLLFPQGDVDVKRPGHREFKLEDIGLLSCSRTVQFDMTHAVARVLSSSLPQTQAVSDGKHDELPIAATRQLSFPQH